MNKNIVNVREPLHQLYNLNRWKGGIGIKYLKDLMKLIEKHKVKDNKIPNIYLNEKEELMPLWVETGDNKKWVMVAPLVISKEKSKKKK